MKSEIKEQMDDFFASLMKVQTSTPPPQHHSVESMASNVTHAIDQTPTLGDVSITMLMFRLSTSPTSQLNLPKQTTTTSYKNPTQPKPPFPPQTPPTTQPNRTYQPFTTPQQMDIPQFGMPTLLWPPTSSANIILQPQFPPQFTPTQTSYP
jgi:hypothetical protein